MIFQSLILDNIYHQKCGKYTLAHLCDKLELWTMVVKEYDKQKVFKIYDHFDVNNDKIHKNV